MTKTYIVAATLVVATGCGRLNYGPADSLVSVDAGQTAVADSDAQLPLATGTFGEATPLLGMPEGAVDDPSLTADLLEIYFEQSQDLYVAIRPNVAEPFATPVPVDELNTGVMETNPEILGDGLHLFFSRMADTGRTDLFETMRTTREALWSTPVLVTEFGVDVPDAGLVMNAARTYAVAHNFNSLVEYSRESVADPWGQAILIDELNVGDTNGNAFLSSDGLQIYYQSTAIGDGDVGGDADILQSTRDSLAARWSTPVPVDGVSGVGTNEGDPWLSPNLDRIIFWRELAGARVFFEAVR